MGYFSEEDAILQEATAILEKRGQGRPLGSYSFGAPKSNHQLRLTDTAWAWLKAQGGAKWVEEQARR